MTRAHFSKDARSELLAQIAYDEGASIGLGARFLREVEAAAQEAAFAADLRNARNKALAHNDLATIVSGGTLGAFQAGDDDRYFERLQEFASLVHDECVGVPRPFENFVESDVSAFLSAIPQQPA